MAAQITYGSEHNGLAAKNVAMLANADVSEQCSGVQVGEDWQVTAAGLGTGGSNGIGVGGSNDAFQVWSQRAVPCTCTTAMPVRVSVSSTERPMTPWRQEKSPSSMQSAVRAARRVRGFTLLELLAVLAIIGILAAVLIPNLIGLRKRPHDLEALQCGSAIVTAQITYESEHQGVAADRLDQLKTRDVSGACRKVQVAGLNELTAQDVEGTNNLSSSGASDGLYAFKVWSAEGTGMFVYDRWTGQRFARVASVFLH
ncbi:type II secretion system protein [Deinococcus ruber]|uniref:type II secretion system protein n=1 Tax=Deinococcus ruber TaxID=1848197 RepID=UPI001E608CF2|nr:type II secretion system protein [Deinococcus ruber]